MAVKKIQRILPSERRETARQNLRQEILAASREIIASEGFHALTMRKLAERIGYSAAALYLHFRNRDEIALEVSREGYADLFAALSSATEPHRDNPRARLHAFCEAYVQFGLDHPQTYSLIFIHDPAYLKAVTANSSEDDPATRSYELLIEIARDLLAATVEPIKVRARRVRNVTPTELAETLWAGMHGIVSLKLTCPAFPTAPAEIMTQILFDTLLNGLTTDRHHERKVR